MVKESSLYESEPLGDAKDWYVNGAVETVLGAACLAAGLRPAVKVGYGIYAAYLVTNPRALS